MQADLASLGQLLGQLLSLLLRGGLQRGLDSLGVLLEQRAKLLLLDINLPLLKDARLVKLLSYNQRSTSLLSVNAQIVGTAVSTANALDPAGGGQQLGIPAVAGIVSHLVSHVLTEAHLRQVDTDLLQEEVDSGQEVSQSLVVNKTLLNGLANRNLSGLSSARQLGIAVEENKLDILNLMESAVLLATLGVDEVLNLGHEELTNSQQTGSGGNLVSVRLADRGGSERHGALVELQKLSKVEELTLGSLGTQVAGQVAAGTNGSLEHEVEGDGLGRKHASGRVLQVILLDQLAELGTVVVVDSGQNLLVLLHHGIVELDGLGLGLLLLLLGVVLLLHLLATSLLVTVEARLEDGLDEVVGSEDLAVLGVLAHPVGKLVDVATGLENLVGGQDGAVDLEHVLLEDKVLAPLVNDVGLESTSWGAIVVETANTSVDLEGGGVEDTAPQHSIEDGLVEGLALEGGRGGSHGCGFWLLLLWRRLRRFGM